MKPSFVIACSLAAVIGFGACATYAQSKVAVRQEVITTKTSTPAYVPRAQIATQYEIEASKIAAQRAQKVDVQQFARKMVDEHSKAAAKFAMAVEKSGLKIKPVSLDTDHLNRLEQLRTASTASFDRLYITLQLEAHEKALALHQGYAAAGDRPPLRAMAQDTVPMVQTHLQDIRNLSGSIGTES